MNFKQCQYRDNRETARGYIVPQPCKNDTMGGDFCPKHGYCAELLELGRMLSYPRFVAAFIWNRETEQKDIPVLFVGAGRANWEAYAEIHSERHHNDMMHRLQIALRQMTDRMEEERKRNAIINARSGAVVSASAA